MTTPPNPDPSRAAIAAPTKTGHARVNGIGLYDEIRGAGEPLILLHGGSARSRCSGRTSPRSPRTTR
jgi:hypothetical protein